MHRHASLTEIRKYRRIQEDLYVHGKAVRDVEPAIDCFRRKVAAKILSCEECLRRYEEGTVIKGYVLPPCGVI